MRKEFIILIIFVVAVIFMTVNDSNLENVENQKIESLKYKLSQENFLVNKGELIKLSNGVTIKRNSDLIIIQQQKETIIVNKSDTNEIIAFLEN
tara:strand:+ start:880 stop:1161 length:282 start_codon:yes stop_codon:yes gene_type:complete